MQVTRSQSRLPLVLAPWTTVEGPPASPGVSGTSARYGVCTAIPSGRMGRARRYGLGVFAVAVALASGCDGAGEEPDEIALAVAERTADAVAAKTKLALVGQVFDVARGLEGLDAVTIAPLLIEELRRSLQPLVAQGCVPTLETDDRSYLRAVFDGCNVRFVRLDGDLRMELSFETAPCDTGECVTAAVWSTDDFDLAFGPRWEGRPELSGPLQVRAPVDRAAPMGWTTTEDFTVSNRLGSFTMQSRARWSFDAAGCVDMDLFARLERIDEQDTRRRRQIGTMVTEVAGLRRCPRACPEAGHVQLSFGQGRLLAWDYGDDEVEVVGPRGIRFLQAVTCE